ncbi:hypothetical protein BV22DRAFT_1188370 [Leucogyrophana mollusca]|uniref:Uncharacterized protein n=1 Tax=Leucogyrophana mollusca TaxID=85980 RepID=A0ACB8AVP3_9AGAM|nr:hypothetical protein BV22DRAFT_1188370 [Leucogyrophana mollusca]
MSVPITVSSPPTIFIKIYVDIMLMPKACGYRYVVAARDDLSLSAEGRALKNATADNLARFFWEEIFCHYGISIIKACEGDINQWPTKVHHTFFADKVTTRRSTGFSPFFILHGIDPVLPFDLAEATWLVDGFYSGMTTEDMVALRIRQLEKCPEDIAQAASTLHRSRIRSKEQFEKIYARRMRREEYKPEDLVLLKPRYLGPSEVVQRTKGGSYVLQEMDGTISRRGHPQFHAPYHDT